MEQDIQYWRNQALEFISGVDLIEPHQIVEEYRENMVKKLAGYAGADEYFVVKSVDNTEAIVVASKESFLGEYSNTAFLPPVNFPELFAVHHDLKTPTRFHFLHGYKTLIHIPLEESYFIGKIFLAWNSERTVTQGWSGFVTLTLKRIKEAVRLNTVIRNHEEYSLKFNAVFHGVSQALIFSDDSGRNAWLNPQAKSLLGISTQNEEIDPQLVSFAMRQLREKAENSEEIAKEALELHQDSQKVFKNWFWRFSDQVFKVYSCPITSVHIKGRLWVFEDISEIFFANRKLSWYNQELESVNRELTNTLEQISEQNKLIASINLEISQKNENLERLNHEKDNLIHVVSHDLRTPISQFQGLLKILEKDTEKWSENQKVCLSKMREISSQSLDLISEILDLGAIEQGDVAMTLVNMDIVQWFEKERLVYSTMAERKNITFYLEHSLSPIYVRTDRKYLKRIMDNLISNAFKYSYKNTEVKVLLGIHGGAVQIQVQDQGQGMTEEDQKHLFEKFKKLSARPTAGESSSGLGLSIVKALVEQMQGSLTCSSEWGKGSTFVVRLPSGFPT